MAGWVLFLMGRDGRGGEKREGKGGLLPVYLTSGYGPEFKSKI